MVAIRSIGQVMNKLTYLQGTKGTLQLGKKQLALMAKSEGIDLFSKKGILKGIKDPIVDVAYKDSKQGFTVGVFTVKDGEQVLGKGALSLSGTADAPIIKSRFNFGDGAIKASAYTDPGRGLNLDDVAINVSRKNGIDKIGLRYGETVGAAAQIKEKETVNLLGRVTGQKKKIQAEYGNFQVEINKAVEAFNNKIKAWLKPPMQKAIKEAKVN